MLDNLFATAYSCCLIHASYLVFCGSRAPNPSPGQTSKTDSLANSIFLRVLTSYGNAMSAIGVLHAIFSLLSSETQQSICTPTSSLSPALFTWSSMSTLLLGLSLAGGHLRLLAFRHLQKNFTFQIAQPEKLVQSGVFAYMQHPSYVGALILAYAYSGLVIRSDGVLNCWMSDSPWSMVLRAIVYLNCVYLVAGVLLTFRLRIPEEEVLLRRSFGAEWEEYHRRTARFIPWVF